MIYSLNYKLIWLISYKNGSELFFRKDNFQSFHEKKKTDFD